MCCVSCSMRVLRPPNRDVRDEKALLAAARAEPTYR
jgi:hypothetical protein